MPGVAELQRINAEVNAGTTWRGETEDDWSPLVPIGPGRYADGDCDSYSSRKMLKCVDAGFSDEHMALVTCYTAQGEYHCVLAVFVEEDQQVWILDNRYDRIKTWDTLVDLHGYDFHLVPQYMEDYMKLKQRS